MYAMITMSSGHKSKDQWDVKYFSCILEIHNVS